MTDQAPPSSGRSSRPRKRRRAPAATNDVLDGKYRLLRPLKRGSMGAVFAAENLRLGVPVAVKVVRADVQSAAQKELAKRIFQEAHAAFLLDHAAIMRVLDVGTTQRGDPYVVMELLRGETLESALQKSGPVEPAQAIRVLLPIAHALVVAHECNVVHRDVKPQNVFLARTSDGRVQPKLIDFGLARAAMPSGNRITQAGNTMGSPAYMPPEQIRGDDVTGQADLWGFCVTLYEMVTGEQPFDGERLEVLFTRILFDPPIPLTDYKPAEKALWAIIDKGLHKDVDKRWGSMRELGAALAAWLVDQGYGDDICHASVESMWLQSAAAAPDKVDVLASASSLDAVKPHRDRLPSASERSTGRFRRSGHLRWLIWLLCVLALAAIAGAVCEYLQVPIPGVPERWRNRLLWHEPAAPAAPAKALTAGSGTPTGPAPERAPPAATASGAAAASGPDSLSRR